MKTLALGAAATLACFGCAIVILAAVGERQIRQMRSRRSENLAFWHNVARTRDLSK